MAGWARRGGRLARSMLVDPGLAWFTLRVAWWILLVSILARTTSLPRAHGLMATSTRRRVPAISSAALRQLTTTVDRLLAIDLFVFRPSCWRRAMVLQRFLALAGVDSRINFGIRKGRDHDARDGARLLQGHAWLERDGQPFLEDDVASYVITFSLPRERHAPGMSTAGLAGVAHR